MNDDQIEFWNGPASQRWVAHQVVLDRALARFGAAALERAGARVGERVLDVGCGCGDSAIALARQVTASGVVLGVDVSAGMLARARERGAGLVQLRFVEADAASFVTTPPTAAFDLIFSRFGVMFFNDPAAAFAHLRVQLRDTGRMAFACWRAFEENPWARLPLEAARQLLPETPAPIPAGPGPYAFADRARLEQLLAKAGFEAITIERFDALVLMANASDGLPAAVEFAISSGPAARLLATASEDVRAQATERISALLAPFQTQAGYELEGSSWLVSARALG